MLLPPSLLGFKKLSETTGPSLLVAVSKYGSTFLVPGGNDAIAIMLDGAHAGVFIKVSEGER